jgi:predicted nucleic acid-binding protein
LKLFDTTFLIDLVSGDRGAARKAEEVDAQAVFKAISTITVHEYLRGVYYIYMYNESLLKSKLIKAEAELARFEILPYTYEIAKTAAEIDAALTRRGETISLSDVILAATALYYKLTLVTRNIQHFMKVPNLKTETY